MTLDRDFERIASAWLADGPTELSDRVLDAVVDEIHLTRQRRASRVPWRFPTMSMPARVAALIAVGALAIAGAIALGGIGGLSRTNQTTAPTAAPAVVAPSGQAVQIPALTNTFTSPRLGYSVKYPDGWALNPATVVWEPGKTIAWGDGAMDELTGSTARLSVASQNIPTGQAGSDWLIAYCGAGTVIGVTTSDCATQVASWPAIKIGGFTGKVAIDGEQDLSGAIGKVGESRIYDAVVVIGARAYALTLDGDVDRPYFEALLATFKSDPSSAVDLAPLDRTFTSPTYGYSIKTNTSWTVTPAQEKWVGVGNDDPMNDTIAIAGTDTTFSGASQSLGKQSYEAFLSDFHDTVIAGVPAGCDGGAPSTWPPIQVGGETGALDMWCNAAVAVAHVNDRVYLFGWGNSTFNTDQHMSLVTWKALLRNMTLDPFTADLSKTFTSPTYGYSILLNPAWTTHRAPKPWRDYSNSNDSMDSVDVTADQGFGMMSQPLNGRTFDEFVETFYEDQLAAIGPNCVGGQPSTWAPIQIGDQTGKVEIQCGSDEALVQAGNRVYLFELGDSSPGLQSSLSIDSWESILHGVTLQPDKAKT
jgi:hypothetical protein